MYDICYTKGGRKMTDRAKQIEEMAIGVCEYRKARGYKKCDDCDWGGECGVTEYARELYDAGYRKQSDVAENIIAMLKAAKPVVKTHFEAYDELIENIAAEYGVEVEK